MKKHTLHAEKRTIVGRKVKALRKQGKLPATVYGKDVKSQNISVEEEIFDKVYEQTGETGLIELSVDNTVHPVLVHSVQRHPVKGTLLHIEFHQVNLKEEVKANVPIEPQGTSPAVEQKLGVFIQVLNELEVTALPTDLPEHISVDISGLANVNDELKVTDLKVPSAVTVLSDKDLVVMRIAPLAKEESVAPPPAPEEGEKAGETEEAAQAETAEPAAEKSAEESKSKEAKAPKEPKV